ncbi:hypothetical protein ABZP36_029072 [Zizania latifolia]
MCVHRRGGGETGSNDDRTSLSGSGVNSSDNEQARTTAIKLEWRQDGLGLSADNIQTQAVQGRQLLIRATLDDCKRFLVPIIEEYFSTGDMELAASELSSLGSDQFHNYFVKKLISMAMDRHDKETEMASVLLSALYVDLLSSFKMSESFMLLLESTEDLAVDIPDANDILVVFVACAVVDEILLQLFSLEPKHCL